MSVPLEVYSIPIRRVKSPADVKKWLLSQAFDDYYGMLLSLNEAARNTTISQAVEESDAIRRVLCFIDQLSNLIDQTPPIDQPQRFGNKAFKQWLEKVDSLADEGLAQVVGSEQVVATGCIVELKPYLMDSFGNSTRIDYGTGHEAAFLMFLCCLFKLHVLEQSDCLAVVVRVFKRYLDLCRKLQLTYRMEPAGSHGMWSLDDFQFVPFILGSAQLLDSSLEPSVIEDGNAVNLHADENLFFNCIQHINKVKTGPFCEHSRQLYDISGVPRWSKVNQGLLKMYKAEVLEKFPVVQHFLFGSLLSFASVVPEP